MATDYITLAEFKDWLGRTVLDDDVAIAQLISEASRWVDGKCGRRFYADLPRAVADGVTTDTDQTVTSATAAFTVADVGMTIAGTGIPASTTIRAVTNSTTVELSAAATVTDTGVTLTLTSTARVYRPLTAYHVGIDDAVTITAVDVDDGDAGTYATAWTSSDWYPLPFNGVGSNGVSGWPITSIASSASLTFPCANRRPAVRVTGTWGWAAVPVDIKTATFFYTHRLFYLRDTPGGTTMSVEFGAQPIRTVRDIESLIAPYSTTQASDGRFLVG
jgi:hypothetical protein